VDTFFCCSSGAGEAGTGIAVGVGRALRAGVGWVAGGIEEGVLARVESEASESGVGSDSALPPCECEGTVGANTGVATWVATCGDEGAGVGVVTGATGSETCGVPERGAGGGTDAGMETGAEGGAGGGDGGSTGLGVRCLIGGGSGVGSRGGAVGGGTETGSNLVFRGVPRETWVPVRS
jgi:hypothetical protein